MAGSVIDSRSTRPSSRSVRTVALVFGVAALTGVLTSFGESLLPRSISAVANSSAPWALIAFACVYLSQTRRWIAAALGAASLLIMDISFDATVDIRGGYYPHHYLAFWVIVAIVIGPLVGLCASWLRTNRVPFAETAVAVPSAIVTGEGVFMIVRLPGVSSAYALACVVGGAALFAILARVRLHRADRIAVSFALYAAIGALFYAVYGLLPLVLNKVVP